MAKVVPMPIWPSGRFGVGLAIPKAAPVLVLIQKSDWPLMLSPAGRFAPVKKLGWPKVSRFCLNCAYVTVIGRLVPPKAWFGPMGWRWPVSGFRNDPRATSILTVILFVIVLSMMATAACSSRRKAGSALAAGSL